LQVHHDLNTAQLVQRRGEFTVNIAYIEGGTPIAGVVYAPAKDRLFATREGKSYEYAVSDGVLDESSLREIRVSSPDNGALAVIASKSHRDQATDDYIAKFKVSEFKSAGSSLKFCLLAAGEADFYPRLGRTMEWDTAAGHAVLGAAGGIVLRHDTHDPLTYGKPGYENPFFLALSPEVAL
jgi:3'(2'), 5'-bisphosphate nucleotidase